jgi:hypothetical protein
VTDFGIVSAEQVFELLAVGAALLLGLLLLALGRSPRTITAALVGATGASVHLFTLAVLLWLCFTRPFGSRQWPRVLGLMTSTGLLAVTVLYGDLVNSPTLALQLLALSGSAALIALRAEARDAAVMMRAALVVITAGAMVGLLQVVDLVPIETWHTDISALGRPIGIWPEPDWLGLLAAIGVVLAWRLPLATTARTVSLTINGAAFVLAFARAAWVALAVSIAIAVIAQLFTARRNAADSGGRRGALLALALLATLALTLSPNLRSDLIRRVETLTTTTADDVSGQARLQQTQGLLHLAESAAPFGHGLSASGRVGVSGNLYLKVDYGNNVASNWLLGLWVDGALLAIPLMLFLILLAARAVASPVGQALVVLLINSLFSNALFLPVTWMLVGLTMATLTPYRSKMQSPREQSDGQGLDRPQVQRTATGPT